MLPFFPPDRPESYRPRPFLFFSSLASIVGRATGRDPPLFIRRVGKGPRFFFLRLDDEAVEDPTTLFLPKPVTKCSCSKRLFLLLSRVSRAAGFFRPTARSLPKAGGIGARAAFLFSFLFLCRRRQGEAGSPFCFFLPSLRREGSDSVDSLSSGKAA